MLLQEATQTLSVLQDVPVAVLRTNQAKSLVEPKFPETRVRIYLPPIKKLRAVVERMRAVSDYMYLYANRGGVFRARVETESVVIETTWSDMGLARVHGEDEPVRDPSIESELRLDLKRMTKFLHCANVEPENVVCCFAPNLLILHVMGDKDLYLTYYIPASAH